jgi:hypothetical protein
VSHTSQKIWENWKTNYSRKENSPTLREGSTRRTRGVPTPARARECCAPRPPRRPRRCRRPRRRRPRDTDKFENLGVTAFDILQQGRVEFPSVSWISGESALVVPSGASHSWGRRPLLRPQGRRVHEGLRRARSSPKPHLQRQQRAGATMAPSLR